jgi:hypothetical protein
MLKRQYGDGPVSFYQNLGSDVDLKTGRKTVQRSVTVVDRVISLPATLSREVVRSISLISAEKSFVQGGFYDATQRTFILDRRDAPGLVIREDDWIVYRGKRYEIMRIKDFDLDAGYVITARHLGGEVPEQIFLLSADHLLELSSEASGTK